MVQVSALSLWATTYSRSSSSFWE